jgi:hypothetical protein
MRKIRLRRFQEKRLNYGFVVPFLANIPQKEEGKYCKDVTTKINENVMAILFVLQCTHNFILNYIENFNVLFRTLSLFIKQQSVENLLTT